MQTAGRPRVGIHGARVYLRAYLRIGYCEKQTFSEDKRFLLRRLYLSLREPIHPCGRGTTSVFHRYQPILLLWKMSHSAFRSVAPVNENGYCVP